MPSGHIVFVNVAALKPNEPLRSAFCNDALLKCALGNTAPVRLAPFKYVTGPAAPIVAPVKSAVARLAPVKFAPDTTAPASESLIRSVPHMFAPMRRAPVSVTAARFAPL